MMLQGWVVIAIALGYIGLLFVVASYGDRLRKFARGDRSRLLIYPLCLAIYCTSWTFFGSVGLASKSGFDFLTIYVGPILMIGLCTPLVLRIVRLAKSQNITSIADFIAARYGKRQSVAALVALIAIVGTIPYIALQLKAVSAMFGTVFVHVAPGFTPSAIGDTALLVALAMAAFAILFGTRHIDATEHQDGLMLAIATESIVKLAAFLAVGLFVTYWMFDGPADLFSRALARPDTAAVLTTAPNFSTVIAMTLLSTVAIILLPRQFHVTVVENHSEAEIRRARWMFPLYLVLINLFVVPIALAGLLTFPAGQVDSDMFVLALPLSAEASMFTIIAFIGGLSAATAMVIVESVALAIMVSNDLVVPFFLKRRSEARDRKGRCRRAAAAHPQNRDLPDPGAGLSLLSLPWATLSSRPSAFCRLRPSPSLRRLFSAVCSGGRDRARRDRRAHGRHPCVVLYIAAAERCRDRHCQSLGAGRWPVRDLVPAADRACSGSICHNWRMACSGAWRSISWPISASPSVAHPKRSSACRPICSCRTRAPAPSFRLWRSAVTVDELMTAVARYIGQERTRSSFESFAAAKRIDLSPGSSADFQLLQHAEHLLASAIGAASSRLVLSLLLRKRTVSTRAALKLLDDANAAIHYNREILQTALEHVSEGIAVFDKDLQLVCWNRTFGEILDLPRDMIGIGARLDEILRVHAGRGSLWSRRHRDAGARAGAALRGGIGAIHRALRRARAGS